MGRPLVVEICGLPGAGKSAIAAHTCRALLSSGIAAQVADLPMSAAAAAAARVRRRAASAAAEILSRPVESARAARLAVATSPSPRDGVALLAQWLTVQRLAARHRHGVALIEEGPVQTLWSLALRARRDTLDDMRRCLAAGSGSDLVVVVDAPTDVLLNRLDLRSSRHSRTQLLAPACRGPELEHGRRLLDLLITDLPQERLAVVNDGSAPLIELGRRTAEWVLRAV